MSTHAAAAASIAMLVLFAACTASNEAHRADTAGTANVVTLAARDFVLLCLVTAPDGRSHVEHGMIQHIRIN